jgi:general secretion pathway protein L
MSDTLFIRFPAAATASSPFEWVRLDDAGVREDGGVTAEGDLASLSALGGTTRMVVLVPAAEVSFASAELPTRSASRALQLAPFALEEQLAGDVETLHFAAGPVDEAGRTPFVVVAKATMERWLELLQQAGLVAAALVPDLLAVPDNPGHTVLWLEAGQVVVRPPGQWPMALDADPLESALDIAGVTGTATPPHVLVYAAPDDHAVAEVALGAIAAQVASLRVQLLAEGALPALARSALHVPPVSLLQGTYASRGGRGGTARRWRLPMALAASVLVLGLASLLVDLARAKTDLRRLDALIADAAHQAMPDVKKLVDPRRQVEARLLVARAHAGATGLLGALGALATVRAQTPSLELQGINYTDGTTDLEVTASDVAALEQVRGGLSTAGFTAQLQAAGASANGTAGRLQLVAPVASASGSGATP